MIAETFPDRSRSRNPLLLPVRFLLYWVIRTLVLLFFGIRFLLRPKPVRYGLLILVVGGSIAWKMLGVSALLPWSAGSPDQAITSTAVTSQLPQPTVVGNYLKAQAEYDANGMWATMNDRLKQRMMATSNSPEQLQKTLDISRQQGRRYGSATYVGGVDLEGGRSTYLYVLTVEGPNGSSRLPYTFVVDQDGKLSSVQWSFEQ